MLQLGRSCEKKRWQNLCPFWLLENGHGGIEILRAIEARGASKKDASWQFPISQKVSRQNIPERVKRNPGPVAFATHPLVTDVLPYQIQISSIGM